tara:strand:- start:36993 stop:38195 length:1203 start_codon:yes stop_codon:yes gene_type:complete
MIALAVLAVGFYAPMTLLAPLPASAAATTVPADVTIDAPDLDWPGYGASALGVVELPEVRAQDGSEKALPLASITKVVTALTVLDAHPLSLGDDGPTITMSSADVSYYSQQLAMNGSVTAVAAGERYTQRDLLELTLIKSANNFATSLAVWAFGSEDAFLTAAAAWLAEHELDSITIVEPTGIDDANVGTVTDLIELGRLALADPLMADIVGSASETVSNRGTIENTNALLGTDGVDGIKTGTLYSFGANLLFSAERAIEGRAEPVTVIGVILGAPDHDVLNDDVEDLLDTAFANIAAVTLIEPGIELGLLTTRWETDTAIVTTDTAQALVWGDAVFTARIDNDQVTLVDAGESVGTLVFEGSGESTAVELRVGLATTSALGDPGAWWRLTHPGLITGDP